MAVERLICQKQKVDGELVFLQNGEVVVVKAKELAIEDKNTTLNEIL